MLVTFTFNGIQTLAQIYVLVTHLQQIHLVLQTYKDEYESV